MFFTVVMLE